MLFNSYLFWVFFACVLILYKFFSHKAQNYMLLVASYVFYAYWDWRFLFLMLFSAFGMDTRGSPSFRQPTYHRLDKLLRMAAGKGTRVILVAVPVQFPYDIEPLIKSTSEAAGGMVGYPHCGRSERR